MRAPNVDDFEEHLMKLTHAAGCCGQLANAQGRGEEGDALYFLRDGLEQIADEVRRWVDAEFEKKKESQGPRAVV